MKTHGRENRVQFVHGCCLSHFSLRRRHSKQEVINRLRRRIRGWSLSLASFVLEIDVAPEASGDMSVGLEPAILITAVSRLAGGQADTAGFALRTYAHNATRADDL